MKRLPYGRPWIDKDDIRAVIRVMKTDWLTQGPKVREFEKKLAAYCGTRYAVAVSNGTAALQLSYLAAGIKPGDEAVTTPLTFAATANALVHCGAKPVFADIEEDTLNIKPEEIEKRITKKTKAIVIVDFAGHPCDLDEIKKIAKKYKLLLIEDAAHSLGAEYKGKRVGGLADLTAFSFHPVKIISTGEGGAVLTNRKSFYEKMKILRHHGVEKKPEKGGWYYEIREPGHNFRLTDFQCALGISQLKKINKFIKRRREIAAQYDAVFEHIPEIILQKEKGNVKSARHIYPIQFRLEKLKTGRKALFEFFHKQGITTQVHYMPLHLHPFYQKKFGFRNGDFPKAEAYYRRAVTLPLFPKMKDRDIKYVIQIIKKIIKTI